MTEKHLPQDIDAERAALGSIVLDPSAITLVADTLKPEHFYRDAHKLIYRAMLDLYEQDTPPDFITLCSHLERRRELDRVGGASSINALVREVPTSVHVERYAAIVTRKALHRSLIQAAGSIASAAYDEQPDALEQAESLIFALSQGHDPGGFTAMSDIMAACRAQYETLRDSDGGLIGIPTGFAAFDRLTGGLRPSKLVLLAGRPGMGKTSMALCIALHAAMVHGRTVGILSLEMDKEELGDKLVAVEALVDTQDLAKGWLSTEEWRRVTEVSHRIGSTARIHIDDTATMNIFSLRSRARRLQVEHGLDLLIVDYLQLMEATRDGKPIENEVQELTAISRGLKQLAREMKIPVLALAQLSRKVEERPDKRPQLSDLRGSGSLEQDSDIVTFIYRDEVYHPESEQRGKAEWLIRKHRGGPIGDVLVGFEARSTRFYDVQAALTTAAEREDANAA